MHNQISPLPALPNFEPQIRRCLQPSAFLLVTLYAFSLTSLPRYISVGPISGFAVLTLLLTAICATVWLLNPELLGRHLRTFQLAYVSALGFACASIFWFRPSLAGAQDLLVYCGFILFILLSYQFARYYPARVAVFEKAFSTASIIAIFTYFLSAIFGERIGIRVSTASIALFWIPIFSLHLSKWFYGRSNNGWKALMYAGLMGILVARAPLAICIALFAIVSLFWTSGARRLRFLLGLLALLSAAVAIVLLYEPLRTSFFFGTNPLVTGDFRINASGRVYLYTVLWDSVASHPWIGGGVGSASAALAAVGSKVTQPHNDALRLLHDFGLFGASIWMAVFLSLGIRLWRAARQARQYASLGCGPFVLSAALSYFGVLMSMMTDNSLTYPHVMYPVGILVGCALGLTSRMWVPLSRP